MYPRLHNDELPNLEDMLNCFTHFELIEELCEEMKKDDELAEKYSSRIIKILDIKIVISTSSFIKLRYSLK